MCEDPKQCKAHSHTVDEINELKEENKRFRQELDELKKVIDDFRELEEFIRTSYKKEKHPILHPIIEFLNRRKSQ